MIPVYDDHVVVCGRYLIMPLDASCSEHFYSLKRVTASRVNDITEGGRIISVIFLVSAFGFVTVFNVVV